MPLKLRRRRLTLRKYAAVSVKKLLRSRVWLQDAFVTCDPTLQHTATEFKSRIVQERLSKLTLSQVEKIYLDGAWSVLLNKHDVDMSFRKLRKDQLSNQRRDLKCFFSDNSATILTTIKNKIASILDKTELRNSIEDLLLTHVWFNLDRQRKSSIFSAAHAFVQSFKDTQLKLLNVQKTLELCAHSIWNALMYQAISCVIKNKVPWKTNYAGKVVEPDDQHEIESMEPNELADEQNELADEENELADEEITLVKEETPQDVRLGLDEIISEATTASQEYLRCKSPAKFVPRQRCKPNLLKKANHERKSPSKLFHGQRREPNLLKKANDELCMKIPFPSDLISTTDTKILLIQTVLKVQKLSSSDVELSWCYPKEHANCIVVYEIFMLQGLKVNPDLSCWSKFNLEKIKELPTAFVIRGLNSGSRYYFTMRGITDDGKVTPISDVQFINL